MWGWLSKFFGPIALYLLDALWNRWKKADQERIKEEEKRKVEDQAKQEALKKLRESGKSETMTDEEKEKEIEKALDDFRNRISNS